MAEVANPQRSHPTYRRARRRPAHLRTKTGCLTCRRRKKKCDETQSQCLNCERQKLDCVWQLSPSPPQSVSPRVQGQSAVDPDEIPRVDASTRSISRTRVDTLPLLSLSHLPISLSPAITPDSGPLLDFLRSTFLPQLIRPAADGFVTDGLNRETTLLALSYPFFMHALLACSGAEIPTETTRYRRLARLHYTHAVAGLRETLDGSHLERRWVVAMLTIMMLCIYERAKPNGSLGVEIHLAGAARLIAFYSCHSTGIHDKGHDQNSNTEGRMHRLVRESFIFHVATSLPFQQSDAHHVEIETALSLAEEAISQHFRPNILSHSDSPVLGFPPQLFRCIYTVYRLYQSSSSGCVGIERRRALDQDLQQWDERAQSRFPRPVRKSTSSGVECNQAAEAPQIANKLDQSCMGAKLYILGCRLLLRRMQGMGEAELSPTIDQLLLEGMDIVRQLQPDQDYYADYYCWPLLAIGMHLQSTSDRELLLHQVWAFWAATNNGTMRRLADMLDLLWK